MLSVTALSVCFGPREVLAGIELDVPPGTLTAIVGPNGSGKTTLLRAVSGDLPYRGSVRLNGTEVARARPAELAARRGVLAQFTTVAFPFTAAEVVRIGLSGQPGAGPDPAPRALARVGLAGFGARPYEALSGGEQQRVHLARVLTQIGAAVDARGAPRWLFLDEPVASLDIGHQLQVMGIARDHAVAGGGVLAVLHDLNLAAMFADRIVLMAAGRILAQGRPAEVLEEGWLSRAYGCRLRVNAAPAEGPFVLPQAAAAAE